MAEPGTLKPLKLRPFTSRELKPAGWIRRQLQIQAGGLSGNLDKVWPDIRDSCWIGGDGDNWERVPYWLDGFIPLAYLLDDEDLKARAKKYIDHIIAAQKADGWICPCADQERSGYDMWAFFLICKVLALYADCSGDERIEGILALALRCAAKHIETNTLHNWGACRWFECLIPIFWLYERSGGDWLLDFAGRLQIQGIDYFRLFEHYRDAVPERNWTYLTHVVNLAMCLKSGALTSRMDGSDPDAFAKLATETLFTFHGTATGHFTGDECLAGTSPVVGTELCGVVEAMYSYEQLLSIGANPLWGDYLERLAFNALPAALSPDMWTHQYDQMTNQVECSYLPEGKVVFGTNSGESHLFGLEPNFGCCTANFNQGWPKLVLSAFMAGEDGIVSTVLVPSELNCRVKNVPVRISLETEYPFRETLRYTIETPSPVSFVFALRIPGWAKKAEIDGVAAEGGNFFRIMREWKGKTEITVRLHVETRMRERPGGMFCLERGPLVYSVAPLERWVMHEFTRNGVERKFPYCDWELFALSPWNYAFTKEAVNAVLIQAPLSEIPFSPAAPPVSLKTLMTPIEWGFTGGVCEARPAGRILGEPVPVTLIPYGSTNLRVTEMPLKG
ncbi:MAG: glycoside hydrolase family 127 protein [Treponema sp.]|jgi:hypothetical protein|nr:glycoside hydrolase family 127 protein [Treponema sp.]